MGRLNLLNSNRSDTSRVVPNGQTQPQKNLPSSSVKTMRAKARAIPALRLRDASVVAIAARGSSLKKKSSGIKENENPMEIECFNNSPVFSNYTTIQYSLPENNFVELKLYDMTGRTVKSLVKKTQTPGNYSYRWYGENDDGKKLPRGIYFYNLKVGDQKYTDKVLLIR